MSRNYKQRKMQYILTNKLVLSALAGNGCTFFLKNILNILMSCIPFSLWNTTCRLYVHVWKCMKLKTIVSLFHRSNSSLIYVNMASRMQTKWFLAVKWGWLNVKMLFRMDHLDRDGLPLFFLSVYLLHSKSKRLFLMIFKVELVTMILWHPDGGEFQR